uniref:Uncharacterized protein n=1 Tax=Plectus sambesii TaxID=2011161 RepID=A0A914WJC3_9BILA
MDFGRCDQSLQNSDSEMDAPKNCRCLVHQFVAVIMTRVVAEVETLRDQLRQTSGRLGETETENDRLRYLFNHQNQDTTGLAQLRRSLTVAEGDVRRKQEEIEALRRQLITPVAEVERRMDDDDDEEEDTMASTSVDAAARMVPMIKVQVGVLSRFVHSLTARSGADWAQFRHRVDDLIRAVAALSDNAPVDITLVESLLADISDAYERLGRLFDGFRPTTMDATTATTAKKTVSQPACASPPATSVHARRVCSTSAAESAVSASFFTLPFSASDQHEAKDCVVRNEVTAKLASFLSNKYGELRAWATSREKRREALAEALSMEVVLVAEMVNLLESGDNRQRLDCAVRLQEARGVAINLSAIDNSIALFAAKRDIDAAVADLTLNVFATFVRRVKSLVTARGDLAVNNSALNGLFDKRTVAEQVCRFLGPTADSATLEAQLKSHLAIVFAHLQENNRGVPWDRRNSQKMLTFARNYVAKLGEEVGRKIDACLAELIVESDASFAGEQMRSSDELYEMAMSYWQRLKATAAAHNHSMQASPASQLSALHEAVVTALESRLPKRSLCDSHSSSAAVLAVLRGVVDGFVGWSEQRLSVECAETIVAEEESGALSTLRSVKLSPDADDVHDKLFNSLIDSVEMDAVAELYEPLTRALFNQCCVDAAVKLALRAVDSEDEVPRRDEPQRDEPTNQLPFFEEARTVNGHGDIPDEVRDLENEIEDLQ